MTNVIMLIVWSADVLLHMQASSASGDPLVEPLVLCFQPLAIFLDVIWTNAMLDFVDQLEVPALTKSALVDLLVNQMGLNGREACDVVEGFFELILERLCDGEDVKLAGFGNFEVHQKAARPGRNPRTGESVEISPRQVVRFSSGPKFKRRMNDKRPAKALSNSKSERRVEAEVAKSRRIRSARSEEPCQPTAL